MILNSHNNNITVMTTAIEFLFPSAKNCYFAQRILLIATLNKSCVLLPCAVFCPIKVAQVKQDKQTSATPIQE